MVQYNKENLLIINCEVTLLDNLITHSTSNGVRIQDSTVTMQHNIIRENGADGLHLTSMTNPLNITATRNIIC
jgi:hypothetical protein